MSDSREQAIYDHATRIAVLETAIKGIDKNLDHINGSIGKLVWAVILAIVVALVQFILKGGLRV